MRLNLLSVVIDWTASHASSTNLLAQPHAHNKIRTNLFVQSWYATPMASPTADDADPSALEVLRVIAHPARIRLYELLAVHGPSTVSSLASRADLAVGSASYHLRQLGGAGFVEDVSDSEGSADRRNHWWRAVPGGLRWEPSDFLGSASGREASSAAQRLMMQRRVARLAQWAESWDHWGERWVDAALETDAFLMLTASELKEMGQEIQSVIRAWVERSRGESPSDDQADERSQVFMMVSAFPVVEDLGPDAPR